MLYIGQQLKNKITSEKAIHLGFIFQIEDKIYCATLEGENLFFGDQRNSYDLVYNTDLSINPGSLVFNTLGFTNLIPLSIWMFIDTKTMTIKSMDPRDLEDEIDNGIIELDDRQVEIVKKAGDSLVPLSEFFDVLES